MSTKENFSYWKKPYQKWLVLLGSMLLSLSSWMRLQEFNDIRNLANRDELLSPSAWENYAQNFYFIFAINIMILALFLTCFIIGILAKSEKAARFSEAMALAFLSLLWCAFGVEFVIPIGGFMLVTWAILLLVAIGGAIYSYWKSRKAVV